MKSTLTLIILSFTIMCNTTFAQEEHDLGTYTLVIGEKSNELFTYEYLESLHDEIEARRDNLTDVIWYITDKSYIRIHAKREEIQLITE